MPSATSEDHRSVDLLAALVYQLREIELHVRPRLTARLEDLDRLAERSVGTHAASWQETCDAIADDRMYRGLRIPPQVGLVPLGRDPESQLFEFGLLESGTLAKRNPDGQIAVEADTGMVFVLLPACEFTEPRSGTLVSLDAFFLSKYEMTVAQLERLAAMLPPTPDGLPAWVWSYPTGLSMPAAEIGWMDAVHLLAHLGLTLPSDLQWSYACTPPAPDGSPLLAPMTIDFADCNFLQPDAPRRTWPVDHRAVGAHGLFHMQGNVAEWLADGRWGSDFSEGTGARRNVGHLRGVAGGSFTSNPAERRDRIAPFDPEVIDRRLNASTIGVRPARLIER